MNGPWGSTCLIEDPDLSILGGFGHSMAVVVEQNPLILRRKKGSREREGEASPLTVEHQLVCHTHLCVLPEGEAELAGLVCGRVQQLLVARPRLPALVLLLEIVPNLLDSFLWAHGLGIC